jgi:hypothetical protein
MSRPLGLRLKEEETECLSEQLSQEEEGSCKEAKVLRSQLEALLRPHVGPVVGAVLPLLVKNREAGQTPTICR